jgi:hypothetical protein
LLIPAFDDNGLLPVGVHVCTLQEVEDRFGRFRSTGQRAELMSRLRTYLNDAAGAGLVEAVVIDGSFVTATDTPNDIDLVVVLPADYVSGADFRPFQYNILSKRRVRRRLGFDILVACDGSVEYEVYVSFFQQVREQPNLKKGILRIEL